MCTKYYSLIGLFQLLSECITRTTFWLIVALWRAFQTTLCSDWSQSMCPMIARFNNYSLIGPLKLLLRMGHCNLFFFYWLFPCSLHWLMGQSNSFSTSPFKRKPFSNTNRDHTKTIEHIKEKCRIIRGVGLLRACSTRQISADGGYPFNLDTWRNMQSSTQIDACQRLTGPWNMVLREHRPRNVFIWYSPRSDWLEYIGFI